ncbi:unnamed protein product, partial [Amoebophrya sp. A120]
DQAYLEQYLQKDHKPVSNWPRLFGEIASYVVDAVQQGTKQDEGGPQPINTNNNTGSPRLKVLVAN